MAEYSTAEHFNNSSRQRVPAVEFTLPLEPTSRQQGSNFIHKTTSETLRLTDQLHPNQTGPLSTPVDIKKTSSFQITSVRVSSSISNDGEDDSCGEVDDSQTEASEVGSHNQIYVEGDLDAGGENPPVMFASNVPVSLAQQQVNEASTLKLEDKDHGLQRRFRVVKIESAEPFKRGRWLCMDFLDQPSVQPTLSKEEPGSGASSTGSLSDHISSDEVQHPHATPTLHQLNQTHQNISGGAALNSGNQQPSNSIHVVVPHSLSASAASVTYPQTQQQLLQQPMYQTQSPVPLVYPVASVTSLLQQPTAATASATSNSASLAIPLITSQPTSSVTAGGTLPGLSSNVAQPFVQQPVPPGLLQQQPSMANQSAYTAPPVAQQQQQQQQYVAPAASIQPGMTTQQTTQPVVAQIPVMAQQNLIPVQPSSSNNGATQSSPHPPATALVQPSTSIPTHPVVLLPPSAALQQPQTAPVVTVPIHGPPTGLVSQHPHPPIGIQSQPTGPFGEVTTNSPVQPQPIQPSTQLHQQQHVSQPSTVIVQPISTLQQQPEVVLQQQPVQQMQSIQQQLSQQQSGSLLMQQQQQSVVYGSNNLTMPTPVMSIATSMQPQVQLIMANPTTVTTAVVSSSSSATNVGASDAAMGTLPHATGLLTKSQSVAQDENYAGASTDDHASASGSSTVAIDNKIEQAMDLVKSHLMFAVREEVEVLKERIDVLMERIAYLESENQILRAAATQETLAQIAQLEATFPGSGTDNTGGSSVSLVGVASSIGAIVNNTVTSTTTTQSTTTSCTSSQIPNGTSPAP